MEFFNCSRMALGEEREIPEGRLRIVEGAYSCHPVFGEYMGLRVFCDVESQEQLRRIGRRDGEEMLKNSETDGFPWRSSTSGIFRSGNGQIWWCRENGYAGVLIFVPPMITLMVMHSFSKEALVERLRGCSY